MLFQQGGVCATCRQPETAIDPYTKQTKKLAVNHWHETGQIRQGVRHFSPLPIKTEIVGTRFEHKS